MNPDIRKNIESFVDDNQEIEYFRQLNEDVNHDFITIIDKALDTYNYYIKQGVDKRESKIQSLYLTNLYLGEIKQKLYSIKGDDLNE